jgi:electron transport complex protein RnfD
MADVIIALVPALIAAVAIFGMRAAVVIIVCVASCVFFEWAYQKVLNKRVTVSDCSATVTGVILAFNLPVTIPLWQAIFGSAVAIILVKQLFGGLGKNFANPACTARVVMLLAFASTMTNWAAPAANAATWLGADAVTAATPLELMADGGQLPSMMNMFFGTHGGSLGETSALALLLGGLYLLVRRVITWHTPVAFISTTFLLSWAFTGMPQYHILGGGLLLGAIFMATDYPSTPQTSKGRIIFGIGCGLLTVIIRLLGNMPEGVSFAILFMNMLVPFINNATLNKALGGVKT